MTSCACANDTNICEHHVMRGSAVCVQFSVRVCFLRGMSFTGSCLCVLCGLPAAGKSSLAEVLRGRARCRGWDTLLVTYDELIPARDWREAEWKQQRKTVLMCLERFLHQTHKHKRTDQTHTPCDDQIHKHKLTDQTHTPCDDQTHKHTDDDDIWMRFQQIHNQSSSQTHTQPLLVLLDDNFYYQSMRYQIYQLARKNSMGFCQIFLRCPLDVCLQRNQRRSLRVPDEVLVQMFDRMEPPDRSRNSWERQSLTVDSTDGVTDEDVQKLMNLLESTMENPLSPFQDDSQQKDADRQICASNVLHQADQMCRRLISQAMASARENRASSDVLKVLAKELNELKTRFLQELKKEIHHQVSLSPEETINTEKLLMTAERAFKRDTQNCIQTQINKR